jgi:membrane fusion protein, macrolide-specific efflux system
VRRLPSLLVNAVLAVLILGAAGGSLLLVRGPAATATAAAGSRTVTVTQGAVTATVTADGRLAPATTASASFATAGTVTEVAAKVGQTVTVGQLLAKVDPAPAQRALALAEANLDAAGDALDRARKANADTTAAANAVTTARLAVTDAKAAVAATRLAAPIGGTVIAVNGTVGSTVSATTSTGGDRGAATGFVEIADLGTLQVTADFAEADATKLAAGQAATLTWRALPEATATGKVLAVDPSATVATGTVSYRASIEVDTLPEGAKAGQTVSVTVTTGTRTNALTVNPAAVTVAGTRHLVTVRNADGSTESRTVTVGLAGDDAYEITSGLTAGEKVVLPDAGDGGPP